MPDAPSPTCAVLTIAPAGGGNLGATVAVHLADGEALDAAALVRETRDVAGVCTMAAWFLGEGPDNDAA